MAPAFELLDVPRTHTLPELFEPLSMRVRAARLLDERPWLRDVGKLTWDIETKGWQFPQPEESERDGGPEPSPRVATRGRSARRTRVRPTNDIVLLKDRLLYLLQPPLEDWFRRKQLHLSLRPFPYQFQGISFLMPRHAALLADEMGLGKTAQVLLALRLLFHGGVIRHCLIVCPKSLIINWTRELRLWADDVPFEVIGGEANARRTSWFASNCPLKLINYELLTRDAEWATDAQVQFDVVVLDEAQRIKTRESKTAQVVRQLHRRRSWAMTGTPVENRTEDLVSIFAFLDSERIPPNTPAKLLSALTKDCILRRTKEQVAPDVPPKMERDAFVELSPAQRASYKLAENEGIVRLNALGDTISVQHVFELVLRLKQICNFDPPTGESAKLERLQSDLAEVADSGRKAIVFSQWVEPLERLALSLAEFKPLVYHGRVPYRQRQPILERFQSDPTAHVMLMSYGTGSVGLNLQCANYVFLFDRWWNPAVEVQAINRVHRIGQKEPVFVTRFITPDSIEERIAEILEAKRELFEDLIERSGPPLSMGLSEAEIFGLFQLQAPIRRMAA